MIMFQAVVPVIPVMVRKKNIRNLNYFVICIVLDYSNDILTRNKNFESNEALAYTCDSTSNIPVCSHIDEETAERNGKYIHKLVMFFVRCCFSF